jgi:ABC-type branched-subunit amino acid transport system substrate-binding protein
MTKNTWLAIIVIVLLALGGWYYQGGKTAPVEGEPIKIGFIGPLTGDGAAWGEIEKNTIELAVEEINNDGGIKGKPIAVTYEDGKCEGPTALSAAKKLVELDKIKILLVSCSQEVLPIAPYAEQNKVIVFASYAAASNISSAGDYIFRNSWTNIDMAKSMAEIVKTKGTKAAIITEISAFSSDLGDLFVKEYQSLGGTIVSDQNFQQGVKDYRSQILKIVTSKPEVVVVNPIGPNTGIPVLKQLRQLGYSGPIVGNFFGSSKEVQELTEAKDMIYISDPTIADGSLKKKLLESYKNKYGSTPDLEWPLGARYDAVYILKGALEAVGNEPEDIKNYLYSMPPFSGIIGTYTFDKNGDITNVKPVVAEIK